MKLRLFTQLLIIPALLVSCYSLKRSSGGGQRVEFNGERLINAADIALPEGYSIEMITSGLTFPTGICFDNANTPYVVESGYSYGEKFTEPTLKKINPDGTTKIIAKGRNNGPWNGIWFQDGYFYIAEGGQLEGGKILKINLDGNITALVEGLPSMGDHHTNGQVIRNGFILFWTRYNHKLWSRWNRQFRVWMVKKRTSIS